MFFNEEDAFLLMLDIRLTHLSWRNLFFVSSLCQGQGQFSLPGNLFDYNNILITMKKDAAQP